jgi:hypothetical protein
MKAATDGAESVGGETIAVYWEPKLASFFEGKNLANITDESEASSNYVMRTLGLISKGDAYVVCKGGTGTVGSVADAEPENPSQLQNRETIDILPPNELSNVIPITLIPSIDKLVRQSVSRDTVLQRADKVRVGLIQNSH